MEPDLAGVVLVKKRFRFIQIRLILHGERLLGGLKGEIKLFLKKFSPRTTNRNATVFAGQHHYDILV